MLITFCLSSENKYLSMGISLSGSIVTVSKLSSCEFFETFIILSAILLPIKSPFASAVFGMSLFYYYINLSSSIISCIPSGDIYFSLDISLSCSFFSVSELFCGEPFETFVILLAILLPIKSPVMSAVF